MVWVVGLGGRGGPGKPGPYRCGGRGLSGFGGGGREEMVVVGGDGGAEGFAPTVGAEGVDVFALGKVDGLELDLEHIG